VVNPTQGQVKAGNGESEGEIKQTKGPAPLSTSVSTASVVEGTLVREEEEKEKIRGTFRGDHNERKK